MSGASDVKDASPDEDLLEKNTANDSLTSSTDQSSLIGILIPCISLGLIPFFLFIVAFINKLRRRTTRAVGPDVIEESLGASTSVLPLDTQVGTSRTVMVSADEVEEAPEPYYVEPEPEITTEDTTNNCNNVINIDLDSTTQNRRIKFVFQFNDPCSPCTSGATKDNTGSDPKCFQGSFKYPQDGNKDCGQANVYFRGFISENTDQNLKPLPPPPQRTEGPTCSKAKSFPEPFQLQTSVSSPVVHTGCHNIAKIQQDLKPVVYKTGEVEHLGIPPQPAKCTPEKNQPSMSPEVQRNLRTVVYKADATIEEPTPANYRVDGESQPPETPPRTEQIARPPGQNAQMLSSNNAASAVKPPLVQSAKSPQINEKAKQPAPSTHPETISNKTPAPLTSEKRPLENRAEVLKKIAYQTVKTPEPLQTSSAESPMTSTVSAPVIPQRSQPTVATKHQKQESSAEHPRPIAYATKQTPKSLEPPIPAYSEQPIPQKMQATEPDGPAGPTGPLLQPAAKAPQRLPIVVDPQRPAEAKIVNQPIIIDPQHPVDYVSENPDVSIRTQQNQQASSRNEGKPRPSKVWGISKPQEAVDGVIPTEEPNEDGAQGTSFRVREVPKSNDQQPSQNVELKIETVHPAVKHQTHLKPVAPQMRTVVPTLQSATATEETVLNPAVQSVKPEPIYRVPTREARTSATQVVPSDIIAKKPSAREVSTDARTEVTTMTEHWPAPTQDNSPLVNASTEQSLPLDPLPTLVTAQSSGASQTERQQPSTKTPAVFANVAPTSPRAVTSDRRGTIARSIQPVDQASIPTLSTNLRTDTTVHEQVEMIAREGKAMDKSESHKFASPQRSSPPRQIKVQGDLPALTTTQSATNEPSITSTHKIVTPLSLLTDSVHAQSQVKIHAIQRNQEMPLTLENQPSARPTVQHEPTRPTVQHKPTRPTVQHEPTRPTVQHEPTRPTVQHEPTRPTVQHEPTRPTVQHEPATPTVQHKPTRPTVQHEPTRPTVQHEPTRPTVQHEPARPTAQVEPARPIAQHEPARPTAQVEPARPTAQHEPARSISQHEPARSISQHEPATPTASPKLLVSRHQEESPMLNMSREMPAYSSPTPALSTPVSLNQPELATSPTAEIFSSPLPKVPVMAANISPVAPPTKNSIPKFDSVESPQTQSQYLPRQPLSMPSSDRALHPDAVVAPPRFNATTMPIQGPSRQQLPVLISDPGNTLSQPVTVPQSQTNNNNVVFGNNPSHMQAPSSRTHPAPVNVITPCFSQHPQVPPKVIPVQHSQHRAHSQQLWIPSLPTEAQRMPKFPSSARHQVEQLVEDTSSVEGSTKGSMQNEKWIKEHRCARRLRHKSQPPSMRWCKKVEDSQIPPCPPRVPIKAARLCPVVTCGPPCSTTAPASPPPAAVQSARHLKVHGTPSKTKRADSMTLPNISALLTRLGCSYCTPDRVRAASPFCLFHSDLHARPFSHVIYHRPSLCRLSSSRCTFTSSSALQPYQDIHSPQMIPSSPAIFYQPYLMQQYQVMDFYRGPLNVYNAAALQFTPFCTTARRRAMTSFSCCNSPTDSDSESPPYRMPSAQSEVLYSESVEQEPLKINEDLPMIIQVQPQQQLSSSFVSRVPFQAQIPIMELDVAGPSRSRSRPIARSMPPKIHRDFEGTRSRPAVPESVNFRSMIIAPPPLRVASVQPVYEDIVPPPKLRPAGPQEYPLFSKAIATSMQGQDESIYSGLYYEPPSKRRSTHREQTIGTSTVGTPGQLFPLNFIRNDPFGSEDPAAVVRASGSEEILPPTAVDSEVLFGVPKAADSMFMLLQSGIVQESVPRRIQAQPGSPPSYRQVEPSSFHQDNCESYQPVNFSGVKGGAHKELKSSVYNQEELIDKTSGILASLSIDKAMLQLLVGKVKGSHECSEQSPCRTQSLNLDKECCANIKKAKEAEDVDMYTKKVRKK